MNTQTCTKCNKEKAIDQFHRRGDRHQKICKTCMSAYHKARYAKHGRARTTSTRKIEKSNIPVLAEMVSKLEPHLRVKAARYATDNHEAGDIYSAMVENILTKCQPTDSPAIILYRADWYAYEHLNSKRTYNFHVDDGESDGDLFASNKSVEDEIIENEISEELRTVISQLHPQHQRIVSMLSVGLSQAEIARKLGVTEQAVSQKVRNIRSSMVSLGFSPA